MPAMTRSPATAALANACKDELASPGRTAPRPAPASDGEAGPRPLASLTAVMPAYNEEEVLPQALAEAVTALDRVAESWELIVVDDGSTDRTPEILAAWAAREPRLRVLTLRPNRGYSKALAHGFAAARHEAVFYTDADAQFDLGEIAALAPHLAHHPMVVGVRVKRRDPWLRLLTSWVFNRLQGIVLGVRVRDVNCAFKLFRRSFFERVHLSSDGFLIDAELFARARRAGLSWVEVGVTHRPRSAGHSTVKAATVVATLRELWALRRSLSQDRTGAPPAAAAADAGWLPRGATETARPPAPGGARPPLQKTGPSGDGRRKPGG